MVIRFILYAVIIYVLYRIIRYFLRTKPVQKNNDQFSSGNVQGEDLVEDTVCHTYIPISQSYKKELAGIKYYFCSKECYESFISARNKERQQGEL